MTRRLDAGSIKLRAQSALELSRSCKLCPRECGVDRPQGEKGYCNAGPVPKIGAALAHFGEEPPITGEGGAGTIFFSHCNMRCVYCQNYQISQGSTGKEITPQELAHEMLRLQSEGCSCIEPVSPSHYLPGLLEAISIARAQGLVSPIVYNSNGYESALTLELLEGVVDVYLPDLRYSSDAMALEYSGAQGYVDIARDAIMKMYSHTGDLVVNLQGIAISGIIIRLLVLPNDVAGVEQSLMWIRDNLPASVTLSIMSQYSPLFRAGLYPPLNRATSEDQYNEIIDICWDMGLENAFVQDYESKDLGIPDFESNEPFYWPQVDNRPLRD